MEKGNTQICPTIIPYLCQQMIEDKERREVCNAQDKEKDG
jgi:hypothetical protein